jgi:hypothetical protein
MEHPPGHPKEGRVPSFKKISQKTQYSTRAGGLAKAI